ncbi:MAG: phosphopantetheine-binding protein [Deltaproteobacteria bacterium]|nr:phosphopantetheine-binding protein [Deltaproteobacteria bacterium]
MTDQEIIERADAALAREFELEPADMKPEALLREDLGLDSLDAVDMVIVLEQEFGVKIGKDPAIIAIKTVGDLHGFIIAKKRAVAAPPTP